MTSFQFPAESPALSISSFLLFYPLQDCGRTISSSRKSSSEPSWRITQNFLEQYSSSLGIDGDTKKTDFNVQPSWVVSLIWMAIRSFIFLIFMIWKMSIHNSREVQPAKEDRAFCLCPKPFLLQVTCLNHCCDCCDCLVLITCGQQTWESVLLS